MIVKCNKCKEEINKEDLEKNYYICPLCGKLNRMPAKNRLQMLTEKFDVMFNDQEFTDPIDFPSYKEKYESAREKSGETEGVVCGRGTIGGNDTCIFIMEPNFMMGSMGTVVGDRSNAKRMIENKNNEIEKEEKRLRNCQVSVYGLAGGMQILKRFLILAVGVYLIYRNIIKVGGLLVAVQLAEVLAAPAETLAYLLNAKNEARPLVEKYEQLAETEEDRGKTDINDIEDICVEHLSYGRNGVKIIKDVSFTFEKGRKYMLTGSSGSGKSTFLRLIGKLQEGGQYRTVQGKVRRIRQYEKSVELEDRTAIPIKDIVQISRL